MDSIDFLDDGDCVERKEARGSLKQIQFQDRLTQLGVTSSKARDKIRNLTVDKTLALSDIILKLFHVSVLRSPEWALSSLPAARTTHDADAHSALKRCARGLECTQHSVHSKS